MNIKKKLYDKFSIILALAVMFVALAVNAAAAPERIVFESWRDGGNRKIYTVNADGSNQMRVTDHPSSDMEPTINHGCDANVPAIEPKNVVVSSYQTAGSEGTGRN